MNGRWSDDSTGDFLDDESFRRSIAGGRFFSLAPRNAPAKVTLSTLVIGAHLHTRRRHCSSCSDSKRSTWPLICVESRRETLTMRKPVAKEDAFVFCFCVVFFSKFHAPESRFGVFRLLICAAFFSRLIQRLTQVGRHVGIGHGRRRRRKATHSRTCATVSVGGRAEENGESVPRALTFH